MASTIKIAVLADSTNAVAGLRDAGRAADNAQGKVSKLGGVLKGALAAGAAVGAVAAVGLAKGLKFSISAASDLQETISKTKQVFGPAAAGVLKFTDTADTALGQTKQQALDAASTFGIFGKSAGLTGPKLSGFSSKLTVLASDMASFSNTSPQEAVEALGAALRGESEPIRKYGVLLNEGALKAEALRMGLVKNVKDSDKIFAAQSRVSAAQAALNVVNKSGTATAAQKAKAQAALTIATNALKKATTGTMPPLTAQQKILATQSLIMKQTTLAQGDFARTSGGLANQQRIAKASMVGLATTIGTALLPQATKLFVIFNTKVIPILKELWEKHGPAIVKSISETATKMGAWMSTISVDKASSLFTEVKDGIVALTIAAKEGAEMGLGDTLTIIGVVSKFAADNLDTFVKLLPWLVAGFLAAKVAGIGANIVTAASPIFRIAEYIATKKQTKALRENAIQLGKCTTLTLASAGAQSTNAVATGAAAAAAEAEGKATKTGMLTRLRATAAMLGQKVATLAATIAQKAATIAQWLFNAALWANPITWIVIGIIALVAVIVLIATKTTWFQTIWKVCWTAIKAAAVFVFDFLKKYFVTMFAIYRGAFLLFIAGVKKIWSGLQWLWDKVWSILVGIKNIFVGAFNWVQARISQFVANARAVWAGILTLVTRANEFKNKIITVFVSWLSWMLALPGKIITGLLNGLKAGWNKISEFFDWAIDLIPEGIKKALGLASPSKVMAGLGANITGGLVQGIVGEVPALRKAMGVVAGVVTGGVSGDATGILGGGRVDITAGGAAGGNTYHITVNVAPGADLAEAGRLTVKAIEAHQRQTGRVRLVPA